jgi:hypothetical protein
MRNTQEFEIEYDATTKTYLAFWLPPMAVGSGATELDALRDMQQAIHFGVDTEIGSRCASLDENPAACHKRPGSI